MNRIVLILTLGMILGCKSDKKNLLEKEIIKEVTKQEEKNINIINFTFILNAKVLLDDKFRLLYTEELGEKFSGKEIIFKDIVGSNETQAIKFIIPQEDINPARLRLDIRHNNEQKGINIESVEILHNDNKLVISHENFIKYFYPNNYIDYNSSDGNIVFINDEGNDYPFFVSRKPLHDELIGF